MAVIDKPRILFLGTPEFAVPSLEGLIRNGYPVVAAVTQPDRPRGRGRAMALPPVKALAEAHGIPVLQPQRVRDESFLALFREAAPEMVVLAAFGQILPQEMIDFPRLGCLNVHPSLLPKYRGAAPINWALINGEEETGVTIMQMDVGLDSGPILLQEETLVRPGEGFGTLHDRLAVWGAELLLQTIGLMMAGTVRPIPQDHSRATYAPKIRREDGLIYWATDAVRIAHLVRGLEPAPGAYTIFDGKQLKIYKASVVEEPASGPPGTVGWDCHKAPMRAACC